MSMITDQFQSLLNSGLFQESDKLIISVVDNTDKIPANGIDWLRNFWSFPSSKQKKELHKKVDIIVQLENNELIPTLKMIRDYSKDNPGDYILFFHTKGITRYSEATESWRKYMEYFCIERWQDCIEYLNCGFDACGVMWNRDTVYGDYPHFSGAFYWAATDYINTLDHSILDKDWRYSGEFWIGTAPGRIHEFHNSRMNDIAAFQEGRSHYSLPYKRENYVIKRPTLDELNIENGLYLTDKGRIHNYLPDYDVLFAPFRDMHINIFEVGYQYGGSCRLWEKYFPNAIIRSIDITTKRPHEQSAINLGIQTNFEKGERTHFYLKDIKELTPEFFSQMPPDIAIDDGSHTLEDQLFFVKLVYPVLRKGGLMIIEDVADIDNQRIEFEKTGIEFQVIDRRKESGVFDDVLIIYRK